MTLRFTRLILCRKNLKYITIFCYDIKKKLIIYTTEKHSLTKNVKKKRGRLMKFNI